MADDAGALLVRSGLVTASALDAARARQAQQGGTLGEQLVYAQVIGDEALTEFYRQRLLVPAVNPNLLARLPANVVQTIPADMAIELRAIPVQLDNDTNLTVAMGDPSDSHAVDEIGFFTGTYVVRAIATQMQIAWCLAHYYGHVTELGQRLLTTKAGQSPTPVSPRPKGLTSRVNAARHRALAPVTGPVDLPRPAVNVLEPVGRASEPEIATSHSDGTPAPRARTASGEIRVPPRRAESVRPASENPHEDESGPVITIEVSDDVTGPAVMPAPPRRRAVKSDPPELYARAGEVDAETGPVRLVDLEEPRVVIALEDERGGAVSETILGSSDTDDTGVIVIHQSAPTADSQPILLHRKRPSGPPASMAMSRADARTLEAPTRVAIMPAPADGDLAEDDEVVELSIPKTSSRMPKLTQIGIGAMPAVTRAHRDTDAVPSAIDDSVTGVESMPPQFDVTRVDTHPVAPRGPDDASDDGPVAPPRPVGDDTNPHLLAAPPAPSPRAGASKPQVERNVSRAQTAELDDEAVTIVETRGDPSHGSSTLDVDDAIPERRTEPALDRTPTPRPGRRIEHDDVDDGWGPPGTTIPPPLLGAIPGTDETPSSSVIPIANMDSAPLMMAPATPPEVGPSRPHDGRSIDPRSLEESIAHALELIRGLERDHSRDDVVARMIAHLAETHERAGFFSIKNGELTVFAMTPKPAMLPMSALRLDRPSTLQDVVGTRLPYRGPIADDASKLFLTSVLGAAPAEILLVPVAVRERVVGVLFAAHRSRHTFDDQLALVARAAGMSLERILKTKRG